MAFERSTVALPPGKTAWQHHFGQFALLKGVFAFDHVLLATILNCIDLLSQSPLSCRRHLWLREEVICVNAGLLEIAETLELFVADFVTVADVDAAAIVRVLAANRNRLIFVQRVHVGLRAG